MRDNHRGCASADARAARDNERKCSDNSSLHQIWAAVRRSAFGSLLAGGGCFGSASRRVAGPDARSQRPKSPRQQARDNRQETTGNILSAPRLSQPQERLTMVKPGTASRQVLSAVWLFTQDLIQAVVLLLSL